MKKTINAIAIIPLLFILVVCEKKSDNPEEQITLSKTIAGGCNGETFAFSKNTVSEEDTVTFTVINDTLDVFVGLNYICCAPFEAGASISNNDSIVINITDICDLSAGSCYCRCMCYYTWNFLFTDYAKKEYYFKIILEDPSQEEPNILAEGTLDLS
jgi:hypothetical protein